MNPKALKTLEYNKIIDKLTEFAGSALAKETCRNLQPSTDLYEIQALQKETSDALSRIYQKGAVSFRGVRDIRGSIKRLEIGAIIGINELLSICSLLEVCSKVKAYSRNDRDPDFEDSLEAMFQALQPLTPVSSEIRRCIASEEELNDDASPALFKIRRSMRQINDKVHAARITSIAQITYRDAMLVGLFQLIAAIFPGTSRSGATILGGILIGLSRTTAAEFTFFLAVPVMAGASLLKILKFGLAFSGAEMMILLVGMAVSFVVSVLVIKFLMNYIRKHDFKIFGWYRIVLGILVILFFTFR